MQMPPTDAMRDKSESEPRKEGLEEGRQRPSTPPRSFCPASQSSIITNFYTQTHLRNAHSALYTKVPKKEKPTQVVSEDLT